MADIRTVIIIGADSFPVIDYAMNGLLLADDDGLATAVIISLWTDRQANADDALPAGSDRRGWWGDELSSPLGDKIGSRLWLNDNAKQLASVLVQDRAYAIEALQWLIDDGVASAVDVVASNPRAGVRALNIAISRPGRAVARYQFSRFWND
ncbi:MAG: phage GP46 family protein [Janthinobacterium svalbardensis]